jgi:cell division septation protein DedD
MKTIFAVQDPEFGWVGFQTAEEAGTGAIQINCYENLAEFNDAKLEKVRQDALSKLTDADIEALGLEKFKVAGPTRTHPDAASTTTSESSGPLTASRKRGTLKLCLILLATPLAIVLLLLMYLFYYQGGPQQNIMTSGVPSGPSAAALPAAKVPAGIPTPQEFTPQKPPAHPLEQTVPSKVVAPGSEVTPPAPIVKVPPPEKEQEYYGFLVYRYRNYGKASKMQEKMKKRGVLGFIQPPIENSGLSELWAGPFSDLGEARTAEKSLRDLLKVPRKIHKIEGKSTQLGQSGEPKGALAPSPKPSDSAPKPAPLPEGFGHVEIPD